MFAEKLQMHALLIAVTIAGYAHTMSHTTKAQDSLTKKKVSENNENNKVDAFNQQKKLRDSWYDFSIEPIDFDSEQPTLTYKTLSTFSFIPDSENVIAIYGYDQQKTTHYHVNLKTNKISRKGSSGLKKSRFFYDQKKSCIRYGKHLNKTFEQLSSGVVIHDYDFNEDASLCLACTTENSTHNRVALYLTRPFTHLTTLVSFPNSCKKPDITINYLGTFAAVHLNGTLYKYRPLGDIKKRLPLSKQRIEKLNNAYFTFTKNPTGN